MAIPPDSLSSESQSEQTESTREKISLTQWLSGFKNLIAIALVIVMGCLLFTAAVIVAGHSLIIERWPQMQALYIDFGLAQDPSKDSLFLRNIVSERRYIDGAMQLIITGEIHSDAQKTQVIPDLAIEALGPDGHIIESWRIAPPTATIKSGTTTNFSTSFLSPAETVVEVNLSFVEPPHDEQ
ncbi:MAG: hypothetical protein PHD48_12215 [Alphaproteobacteria bacterium]|nr:hypothetical protein [Alphaproteobacteria bacterium]